MALVGLTVARVGTGIGRFEVHADYGDKGMTKIMCSDLDDMIHTIRIWANGDWSSKPNGKRTEASISSATF